MYTGTEMTKKVNMLENVYLVSTTVYGLIKVYMYLSNPEKMAREVGKSTHTPLMCTKEQSHRSQFFVSSQNKVLVVRVTYF